MKKLVNTVNLEFFCDDATGEWGLAHEGTIESHGSGFNAFWNGRGIFHDVFEHHFEHKHKYFTGDNAMNIGGEMAAMGAYLYYRSQITGSKRDFNQNSIWHYSDSMRKTTEDMVQEAIEYGSSQFGSTLECGVPSQKPCEDSELEYQIREYWQNVKKFNVAKDCDCDNSKESAKQYRNSVTFAKIANLHRWGYNMAKKLVPYSYENRDTLQNFIESWDVFCKNNAETMAQMFSGITFKIYKENGNITWTAFLNSKNEDEIKTVKLTENNIKHFDFEDAYISMF